MNIDTSTIAMAGAQTNLRQSLTERQPLSKLVSGERPENIPNELDVGTLVLTSPALNPEVALNESPPTTGASTPAQQPGAANNSGSESDYQLPPMLFLIKRVLEMPKSVSSESAANDQSLARQIRATVKEKGVSALFSPFALASAALHEPRPA
jgi:hypothetical protein